MTNKDIWVENTIENFNSVGVYHRYVETSQNEDDTLTEEASYSPVILEVEHLQTLKRHISTGVWRHDGDGSPSWFWYLLVPKGTEQANGWFPLPLLWDSVQQLSPNLKSVKEHLDMLMAEV